MSPLPNKAIAFTAYNRVGYLAKVLESWRSVRGLDDWIFYATVDPSEQSDAIVNLFTQFYRDMGMPYGRVEINERKHGVLHHPWAALENLFKASDIDFVVRVEDDLLVSDDILEYMSWCQEEFRDRDEIATVHAYTPDFLGASNEVFVNETFSPLNWGTWRDRWELYIRDTWDHDYSTFNGRPGFQCVPMDTEILTKRGWLNSNEVKIGDETIGYNHSSNKSEWTKVTEVHHYSEAPLVRLFSDSKPFLCTPEHTWLVLDKNRKTKEGLLKTSELSAHRTVLTSVPVEIHEGLDITDNEAAILGWVAGDGSYSFYGNGKLKASVSQRKEANFPELDRIFEGLPHSVYEHRGVKTWYLHKAYALDLMARAGNPKTDSLAAILQMSDSQRVAWLNAIDLAEGTNHGSKRRIYQAVGDIAEAIQLAIYMGGSRPSRNLIDRGRPNEVPYYQFHFANPNCYARPQSVEGSGVPVWCVTTELGTWTARQNDNVVLTGNSGWDWNLNTRVLPQRGKKCVHPGQSRVQNIGAHGTHSNPQDYETSQSFSDTFGVQEYVLGR